MPGGVKRNKLDFTVESAKARPLHHPEIRKKIGSLFSVKVDVSNTVQEKEWVTVHGAIARCKLAKAYIVALCDPPHYMDLLCEPDFYHNLFSDADNELRRSMEADYAVVLTPCDNCTVHIQGSDELSVTLAMSKLGDMGSNAPPSGDIDVQLDTAMKQQCDPTSLSSLAGQPEVVKRTMLLEIVHDDSGGEDNSGSEEEFYHGQQNHMSPPLHHQQPSFAHGPSSSSSFAVQPQKMADTGAPQLRGPDVQKNFRYFVNLGYREEDILKVFERVGPNALVNDILDRLVAVSSSRHDVKPKLAPSCRLEPSKPADTRSSLPSASSPGALRYIVIDGSNIAMSHGKRQYFSCRGIQLVVEYFIERGHKEITAFVPAWRKETGNPSNRGVDQSILLDLENKGYLVFTPSRRTDKKRIVPYDDRFIIRLAMETKGIIASNDYFRDCLKENEAWRDTIENRILQYSFVNDRIMFPDDPLGKGGPTLEIFLQHSKAAPTVSPAAKKPAAEKKLCRYYPKCTFGNRCQFRHPDGDSPPPRRENEQRGAFGNFRQPPTEGEPAVRKVSGQPLMGGSQNAIFGSQQNGVVIKRELDHEVVGGQQHMPPPMDRRIHYAPQPMGYASSRSHGQPTHPSAAAMYPPPPSTTVGNNNNPTSRNMAYPLYKQVVARNSNPLPVPQQQQQQPYGDQRYMYPSPQLPQHYPMAQVSRGSMMHNIPPHPHMTQANHNHRTHYGYSEHDSSSAGGGGYAKKYSDEQRETLVAQAVNLLRGLTPGPYEPKVRAVMEKHPSVSDLDTIIDLVMRMT